MDLVSFVESQYHLKEFVLSYHLCIYLLKSSQVLNLSRLRYVVIEDHIGLIKYIVILIYLIYMFFYGLNLCLRWTYECPGIGYSVASLFTRYLTARGIIPESLKSIGQL